MYLGSKALQLPNIGTGNKDVLLSGIPAGEVHGLEFNFSGTGISSAAAFNFKNPSGSNKLARSSDDVDKLLAFIFSNATWNLDGSFKIFEALDVTILRTFLSFILALDFLVSGLCVDGTSVPISSGAAAAFGFTIYLPLSLRDALLEDGDLFKQGSDRVSKGYVRWNIAAIAGNVVLGNGTMTVAAMAWSANVIFDAQGAKTYVGPTYKLQDRPNLQSDSPILDAGARFFLLDDGTTYTGNYTASAPVELDQVPKAVLINAFNRSQRRNSSDENSCARATPLYAMRHGLKFHELDMSSYQPKIRNDAGNTQHLLECFIIPRSTQAVRDVATAIGGGSGVTTVPSSPATRGGLPVPARLSRLIGTTVLRGSVAIPGSVQHGNPSTVK
jgi:hypothetical protein